MHPKNDQAVDVTSISFKTDDTDKHTLKHCERFQRVDNCNVFNRILDESGCVNKKEKYFIKLRKSSSKSVSAISTEEISTTSITRRKSDIWRCKTICDTLDTMDSSTNDVVRRLEQVLWKYKNPHGASVSDRTCGKKSSDEAGNIFKEDEPQEGRTGQGLLSDCREYLANYQESYGTPRSEYSFAALITMMVQSTMQSLWALLYVFINIIPILQMFSFILRFVLDKVLNIRRTKDLRQVTVKFAILAVQLLSVHVCLIFILGVIVFPIVKMAISITVKLVTND